MCSLLYDTRTTLTISSTMSCVRYCSQLTVHFTSMGDIWGTINICPSSEETIGVYVLLNTHTNAHMHAHTHTHVHTHQWEYARAHTHTAMHAHIHTNIHTQTHSQASLIKLTSCQVVGLPRTTTAASHHGFRSFSSGQTTCRKSHTRFAQRVLVAHILWATRGILR